MSIPESQKVILVGYSGHTLVAAEALLLSGYSIKGYLEKKESTTNILGIEYLGYEQEPDTIVNIKGLNIFPAIGDNTIRENLFGYFQNLSFAFVKAIHPKANISESSEIGLGTLVCQGANVNPFVKIGKGVIINTGSIIEHECVIGDFAHIAPGAVLAGNVKVGKGSFVGSNAVIKQGVQIGDYVMIGAGSVVLRDVESYSVVVGNPAKPIKR